jgi:hypothetical protein
LHNPTFINLAHIRLACNEDKGSRFVLFWTGIENTHEGHCAWYDFEILGKKERQNPNHNLSFSNDSLLVGVEANDADDAAKQFYSQYASLDT